MSAVEKLVEVVVDEKDISISTEVDGLTEFEGVNGLGGMTLTEEAFYAQYTRSAGTRSSNLIGDDYPWKYHNINIWEGDTWGAYKRQCTSFVAYRLSSVNKFELPYAYGNAGTWGTKAAGEGYRVDMTPAKGAVAWFGPSAFGGNPTYGHVAWVADVKGDMVVIEEYNTNRNPYGYDTREIPKNHVSGYIHFKDLTGTTAQSTAPSTLPTNSATTLPNSGRYTFTSRVGVKSEAKISSPDLAYYNAGSYVNYDSVLQSDGYQWISYTNYNGGRSYIPVTKLTNQTTPTVAKPTIPSQGTYTFTKRTSVQNEPKLNSPEVAYYAAGGRVNYDRTLVSDGHQWISYMSRSGIRRYARID